MHNILNLYFPMIRSLEDIVSGIHSDEKLTGIFNRWSPEKRMHFIDICTGRRGVKMLYEPFLQELVSTGFVKEAVENHLSALTGQEMSIEKLLMDVPHDSVLMEFVVVLQRTGEQRRVRFVRRSAASEEPVSWGKEGFRRKENVYTVMVLDRGPEELRQYRKEYMYYGCSKNDSGANDGCMREYCAFCMDRFLEHIKKNGIMNMMDAWWVFLVCDEPNILVQLIVKYPLFMKLYEELYRVLGDTEKTVRMMQKNTVQTSCGKKCPWLIKVEQELQEQKKQNAVQAEKIRKLQSTIDKQAYIISEQCRERSGENKGKTGYRQSGGKNRKKTVKGLKNK